MPDDLPILFDFPSSPEAAVIEDSAASASCQSCR